MGRQRLPRKHLVLVEITMSEPMGTTDKAAVQEVQRIVSEGRAGMEVHCYRIKHDKVVVKSYKRRKTYELVQAAKTKRKVRLISSGVRTGRFTSND
jgi:hypothetical protein